MGAYPLLMFLLALWLLLAPLVAIISAGGAKRKAERLEEDLLDLRNQLERIRWKTGEQSAPATLRRQVVIPPPPPDAVEPQAPVAPPTLEQSIAAPEWIRPPQEAHEKLEPVQPAAAPLDLEQFMGVKLFAWLGGLALFCGIVFFVKYAFDNNLVSPAARVAIGFATGAGLVLGGLGLHRRGTYQALSQALCATGVLALYGVTFSAYVRYGFFGQAGAFLIMAAVTVVAFATAVRLNALVVAWLGLVGGFLTPMLVGTGRTQLPELSAYIALLVVGLIAVSRHRDWRLLVTAAAAGTAITQILWLSAHFVPDGYANGSSNVLVPMAIVLAFQVLFVIAMWLERRRGGDSPHPAIAAGIMAAMGWGFGLSLLEFPRVACHMDWLLGFNLAQSAMVMVLVGLRSRLLVAQALSMPASFLHLALWTKANLAPGNFLSCLAFSLAIGTAHAVFPCALTRRDKANRAPDWQSSGNPELAEITPITAGLLSFVPLVLAELKLPLPDPATLFGGSLWMVLVLLGLAVSNRRSALVPVALAGMFAVQAMWHGMHSSREMLSVETGWQLGCYALFLAFPFVFRKSMENQALPWISSALSGVGYFLLVYHGVKHGCPWMSGKLGLLPCAFAAPSLAALAVSARMTGVEEHLKRSRMAWFGGVALLFITLVFPIQFNRHWLTVGWALEGAALLWLYRRVPHVGLQATGIVLLVAVFAILLPYPMVYSGFGRNGDSLLNIHVYTFGIGAASMFAGAWWISDPDERLVYLTPRAMLNALGGVLLFALLNIEIATYFTPAGSLRIQFGGSTNFARDMTYSIAWGIFALGLLMLGIWRGSRAARYAAAGLLALTLLKVFVHDLASLSSVYRIAALIGVVVIAFVASFLYQRFYNRAERR